jgi:hypothetical protein
MAGRQPCGDIVDADALFTEPASRHKKQKAPH